MSRNSMIKWKKEDERNLKKAVSIFNKNVKRLNKMNKDKSFIPSEIDYERTKDLITTRAELNRVLNSLSRFKGKKAYKKVTLPSGEELTNWEKREIEIQKRNAIRRIKKRMSEIENTKKEYFEKDMKRMGDLEYRQLEGTLKNIQNFGKKKSKLNKEKQLENFNERKKMIENWGSSDFEMRKAIIYRENYLKMLESDYSGFDNYEKLVEKIKSYKNPISFYNDLRNTKDGEKLADIKYMYDTNEMQKIFNKLCRQLKVDIEDEDYEIEEDYEEGEE